MAAMATPERVMTNERFAELVDCHFTMASRLRNGQRLPSAKLLVRIKNAFDLPYTELMAAYDDGPEAFGQYIRFKVYGEPA